MWNKIREMRKGNCGQFRTSQTAGLACLIVGSEGEHHRWTAINFYPSSFANVARLMNAKLTSRECRQRWRRLVFHRTHGSGVTRIQPEYTLCRSKNWSRSRWPGHTGRPQALSKRLLTLLLQQPATIISEFSSHVLMDRWLDQLHSLSYWITPSLKLKLRVN